MSAGSVRRHESFRTVQLTSLADDLDEHFRTAQRFADEGQVEDLDALPDEDQQCAWPAGCQRMAAAGSGEYCEHHWRLQQRLDSPAIPAETTSRRVVMQITSPELVKLGRYTTTGGLRKKGQEKTAIQVCRLKVPKDLAELLPETLEFSVELNEDGLLFRPAAAQSVKHDPVFVPAWARNGK